LSRTPMASSFLMFIFSMQVDSVKSCQWMAILFPERMSKVRAILFEGYVEEVLAALQESNCFHLVDIKERLPRWNEIPHAIPPREDVGTYRRQLQRVNRLLEDLGFVKTMGILEQLFKPRERPPIEVTLEGEKELLARAEQVLAEAEDDVEQNILRYRLVREFLLAIQRLKIGVNELRSSASLSVRTGSIPSDAAEEVEMELASKIGSASLYAAAAKERRRFVVVLSYPGVSEQVDVILKNNGFQEIAIPPQLSGPPTKSLSTLDLRSKKIARKYQSSLHILHDALLTKTARLEALSKLGRTERTYVMEGWVPLSMVEDATRIIQRHSDGLATVLVSPPDDPVAQVPTKLHNNRALRPFEMLTEMYGTPAYNEVDPTPFFGAFFVLFMGLMSADLAGGMIIALGGALMLRGAGSRTTRMRQLSLIVISVGVSSAVLGALTGEFMGGILPLPSIIISTVEDPIGFLLAVLVLGVIHVVLGLILGAYTHAVNRDLRNLVTGDLAWLLLMAAGGMFLITGDVGFSGQGLVNYGLAITSLILLLLGQGPASLLDITRLISNIISYVRIMAINLASAWMTRTFALLASLIAGAAIVGLPLAAILMLFSYMFIITISLFVTFAHSLRLHYVEFFGKFFKGGGNRFSPLTSTREYTTVAAKTGGGSVVT